MPTIVLFGASGYTGRLVAEALDRRGLGFVAAGRDEPRVRGSVAGLDTVEGVRTADANDPASLAALCEDADVLVTTVGPFDELGRPVLEAAVAQRCHYLDTTGEQRFVAWAFDALGQRAAEAGITAVPAAGYDFVPGDLLAHLAAAAAGETEAIHVTYAVDAPGMSGTSRGTRRTIASLAGREGIVLDHGERIHELPAEARRLAWFPRPVGPTHAAGFPGTEALTVPRHVSGVRTVRTYMAMPSLMAEAMQMLSNAARWEPVRSLARRLLTLGGDPSEQRRQRVRWACVAEASGDLGIARAWANGTDVYGFTAEVIAYLAGELAAGRSRATGVVAPSEAVEPTAALDELADRGVLRWSVVRPA